MRPIWVRIETVFRFNFPLSSNKLVYFNFSKADDALTPTVTVVCCYGHTTCYMVMPESGPLGQRSSQYKCDTCLLFRPFACARKG